MGTAGLAIGRAGERDANTALAQVREDTAPKSWTCFEEHLLKGRSGADIGKEVGLPPNTVYVNASRVLALQRWIEGAGQDGRALSIATPVGFES